MAAPSGTVWGSIVGSYGRVGIHVKLTHTNTHTTRVITLWFWSKYSISDSTNTLYYNAGTTNATSSKGSVSISTSVSSGSGWSTSNQVKLKEYSHTYARGTSDWGESCAMKLAGIDRVGGTMTATTSYTVPKLASYTVAYNANGGSGAPSSQTKYYGKTLTLSSTKPTRTGYTFQGWATSATGSVAYALGASYTANASVTLYAKWSANPYTVAYNGNATGVSNVPASQTKWHGTALTLSTQKPTLTGHTFLGWATSATGSVAYAAGASYIANAAVTLFAKWSANTYTVSYDANGGSGQPASQTKTYGKTLVLSNVVPQKANYNFKGWGTSANAITASYAAGANYTANAAVTLYAIWELAYTKPRISSISVYRCDDAENPSDNGTSLKVAFSWETDKDVTAIIIEYKESTVTMWTEVPLSVEPSGTNGSIDEKIQGISADASYDVRITVADGDTDAYKTPITRSIAGASYPIDVKKGGVGVAFGKPAEKDGLECDFTADFNSTLTSKMFLGKDIDGYSSSKIVIIPTISYSTLNALYGTTGSADETYFKNLLRWICANYSGYGGSIFICRVQPNSAGIGIINIYDTNIVDATTGLPQYSSGLYIRLGNMAYEFGTSSYTYYTRSPFLTTGGTISGALTVTGATTLNSTLTVASHVYNKGHVYFANDTTYYISSSGGANLGNVVANGVLQAKGATTLSSTLSVAGATTLSSTLSVTAESYMKKSLYMSNACYVRGYTTSGAQSVLIGMGSANWIAVGQSDYILGLRGSSVRLGSSSGTVVTSDRNLKKDIEDVDVKFIKFFKKLRPVTYKYEIGRSGRQHMGFIAQEVEQALTDSELTTDEFGGICVDDVVYCEENKDDEFDDMNYAYNKGLKQVYSLRYEEFISLNTKMIQQVIKENEVLKEIVESQQEEIDVLKQEMQQLKDLVEKLVS